MTASSAAVAHKKSAPVRAGSASRVVRRRDTDAFIVTSLTIAGTLIALYDVLILALGVR